MNTMMMTNNPLLIADSYKYGHFLQIPKNTTEMFFYGTARKSNFPDVSEILQYGSGSFAKKFLMRPITKAHVELAEMFIRSHGLSFDKEGMMRIVNIHGGYMPVEFRAVPEGTYMPLKSMMFSMRSLDERLPTLPGLLETACVRHMWYGSTTATLSALGRRYIYNALLKSSDTPDNDIKFALHDFGMRGVSSEESAGLGGSAHLLNFYGTDTIAGIAYAMDYYNADISGYSIDAAEHSTVTIYTRENEYQAYREKVEAFARPGAKFAVVCDSYDLMNAVKMWCDSGLLDIVKERGATVVLRPDSGDAMTIPVETIELLMSKVGYTTNSKGYRVLPDHVRIIQGDGINLTTIPKLLDNVVKAGISVTNIALGMGGGLLQHSNRDTFGYAMKCSHAIVDGKSVDVFKDPATDHGKRSLAGPLCAAVEKESGKIVTLRTDATNFNKDIYTKYNRLDQVVYRSVGGHTVLNTDNFNDIVARAQSKFLG